VRAGSLDHSLEDDQQARVRQSTLPRSAQEIAQTGDEFLAVLSPSGGLETTQGEFDGVATFQLPKRAI